MTQQQGNINPDGAQFPLESKCRRLTVAIDEALAKADYIPYLADPAGTDNDDLLRTAKHWNSTHQNPLTEPEVEELLAARVKALYDRARQRLAARDERPARGNDVNQESQESQENHENQRTTKSTNESQRPRARCETRKLASHEVYVYERSHHLPSTLSFGEYLGRAIEESRGMNIEEWQSPLFYLVRLVRGHP